MNKKKMNNNLMNLSVFIPLIDIKASDISIGNTKSQFYYLLSDKGSVQFYERGDLINTPHGLFYCVYGKETCVPRDYKGISINVSDIENIDIHIEQDGDLLKDTEGVPLIPLNIPFEWYDLGEYFLSIYTLLKEK